MMMLRLSGVSLAELESALRYSGLFVEVDEANPDYAEIKQIPPMLLNGDVKMMNRVKARFDLAKK